MVLTQADGDRVSFAAKDLGSGDMYPGPWCTAYRMLRDTPKSGMSISDRYL